MSFLFGDDMENLNTKKIKYYVDSFKSSDRYKWMLLGQKYYDVDNDYKDVKNAYKKQNKADNRLIHASYKNIVDEKVSFSFSKDCTFQCDDVDYIHDVKKVLGKYFQNVLEELAYEASNKGIAWLHPYVDEEGVFRLMVVPSEQCIPIWEDVTHARLNSFIRFYPEQVWVFNELKTFEHLEVWTSSGVTHYRLDASLGEIMQLGDLSYPLRVENQFFNWSSGIPFVAFKNNHRELCDLKFVKSIVDNYDLTRSEAANYIQEVKNIIYVLKGYSGDSDNVAKLRAMINDERIILLDADDTESKSDVSALTPEMDITALKNHYEQLKRDIIEYSQSINRDLDKFGSAPSGVALKFLFSGLELKAAKFEQEFSKAIDKLLLFVNDFLNVSNAPDVNVVFAHDLEINESEVIANCINSKGIISDETILANHPWVVDFEQEQKRLKEQEEKEESKLEKDFKRVMSGEDE
ncbi:phage portal protein [Gemella sp. zg-1178]|uniref:phage portal protein n=1 Tax=Gemella sp. zg-1178 TaxID=2840372 RepID=UPI001C0413BD|nr:phage portal protein [Gemella sp. zg-1178]MBU0279276.1 phage portal protein [Gemella sp. zg-1178]